MSKYNFTIHDQLPGLNDYTKTNRGNKYAGAKMKQDVENRIIAAIRNQLRGIQIDRCVHITYIWYEPNRRRDLDNIAFAKKFIQDALVSTGVLQGDGWKSISGFSDGFDIDKGNPRVEVTIKCLNS